MRKPLIIGPAPGRGNGETLAGLSGRRIANLCGISVDEYLAKFERINLLPKCPEEFCNAELQAAKSIATEIVYAKRLLGRRTVILGEFAWRAFLLWDVEDFEWTSDPSTRLARCPHPSGRNRFWNDPANVERARVFWRDLVRRV
jgi:uracil-DNA glycosylase